MSEIFWRQLQEITGNGKCSRQENMSKHTTFRVGGPAEYYACPGRAQVAEIISLCHTHKVPWMVIGNGSNLLVGDKGIPGLVIELGKDSAQVIVEGCEVRAQAGALLSVAARKAADSALTGMEFASGIPGSVGGAVVMNAGAYGGEMKQIVKKATVLTAEGMEKELSLEELDFGYRHSSIPGMQAIVLEAAFALEKGDPAAIEEQMSKLRSQRSGKQPLEYPSAGSTFKRPEGYFAGKLIQDAGLRGYRVGDAQVSEKHCGFVINRGEATAAQIRQLICDVQDKVEEQFGVRLETEVRFVGVF
ncbi:MAG: UDP-N-acetylmuramate dehydrogenase [Lachnospiraceae bacterium]|nr:UDP-N-acetylmuramate dehydrogenase [Lachnospiraceae bacterium]